MFIIVFGGKSLYWSIVQSANIGDMNPDVTLPILFSTLSLHFQ